VTEERPTRPEQGLDPDRVRRPDLGADVAARYDRSPPLSRTTRNKALRPDDLGFGRLFARLSEAVVVIDLDRGRVVLWNPGAERLLGYPAEEAIGKHVEALIPALLEPLQRAGVGRQRAAATVPRLDGQTRVVVPAVANTGQELTLEVSFSAIDDAPAPGRFVLALMRDVTERVRAREAVERQAASLRAQARLLDLAHDAILVWELQSGAIRFWNRGAEQLYGWTSAEVLGRTPQAVLHTQFPRPLAEINAELRRTGQWEGELVHTRRDGATVVVASRWALQDEAGQPRMVLGINRDITDRKRAEEERAQLLREQAARAEAEAALRERDQVLATVSHDLKTPLTTIRGQADLLQRRLERAGAIEPERLAKGLELIGTAARRMGTWIDELLDAARLEAGRPVQLHPEPTDLVALAWQAAAEQQRTTERHRIRVHTAEAKLIGIWDPVRLGRVLDNLLGNAIKFSPAGGEVVVSVAREADTAVEWAVVSVRDQGIGIPAEDLRYIFERFRRGTNVAGRIAGTGLGLAGACHILQLHGGSITVDSQEGRGSTFTLRLPLPGTIGQPQPSAAESAAETEPPASAT
jgi:PAS domain S-box-containing protein